MRINVSVHGPEDDSTFRKVCEQIARLSVCGHDRETLDEEARLIEDLGLDSLKLVDLTVALETALAIDEFPMQDWVDDQVEAGLPLTVGELVKACEHALRSRAFGRHA